MAPLMTAEGGLRALLATIADQGRTDPDVIALEARIGGERRRINRLPGESLAALLVRLNPGGHWLTRPEPIFLALGPTARGEGAAATGWA